MANPRAFIALGSNLPFGGVSADALLARAVSALTSAGLIPLALSGIWKTAAWPPSDQPDYYNAVVQLDPAGLSPQPLYQQLREIELRFGRVREAEARWAARTLDLDILAIDGWEGTFGGITLPHPRMQERVFVLAPLAEIASDWRHPRLGRTAGEMLGALPRTDGYRRVDDLIPAAG